MVRVGLVQINRGLNLTRQRFEGRQPRGWGVMAGRRSPRPPASLDREWLLFPYSVGLLQAYARRHAASPGRFEFLTPIARPLPVDDAVARLRGADVAGFSVYVWNIELSLATAARLRAESPDTLIVFGGPQVPDDAAAFLARHPQVDLAVHGEGERTFLGILEALDARDWSGLAGISYRDGHRVVRRAPAPRLQDLSAVPSPYLTGVFDPLIAAHPAGRWILMWETNRGCPFACTFCDWGSAVASKVHQFDMIRLRAELDWFGAGQGEVIFCCDANFGILPRDLDIVDYAAAVRARTGGFPRALSVQHTKNATERSYRVQKRLADAGLNAGVTLSLQSTDPGALHAVKRDNISLASFHELQRRYRRDGIDTYTDMILGLPGETYVSYADGIAEVMARGQHHRVQFYNCSILPNAEMATPAYRADWGLITVQQRIADMHQTIGPCDPGPGRDLGEVAAYPEVAEYIETVVATRTMPPDDWVRAKAFWWTSELLHYDRLLQVALLVLAEAGRVPYRAMIEAFTTADAARWPALAGVQQAFQAHARAIQAGGGEFVPATGWLNVTWPADQHALIGLVTRWQIDAFYDEAAACLAALAAPGAGGGSGGCDPSLLRDAVALNRALLRLPFEIDDLTLDLEWNVWAFYRGVLTGTPVPLAREAERHRIDRRTPVWLSWDDWFEHVIFCQNQKSAYLYPTRIVSAEAVA